MSLSLSHKQPPGMFVLFMTEIWERFGFYVIQSLLVLYLTQSLGWSDDHSYRVTGGFTAFVFIAPVIGGYLADKLIGYKQAILLGNILLILGYTALTVLPSGLLTTALSVIIVGNAFFKPNISSLLGTLYDKGDVRRESGFTLFYMGINIGSLLATLSAGFVKDWLGWSAAFALAVVGLLIGLVNFVWGARVFKDKELRSACLQQHPVTVYGLFYGGLVMSVLLLAKLMDYPALTTFVLALFAVFLGVALLIFVYRKKEAIARYQLLALIILCVLSVLYWSIWFQIFFSLNLFIERNLDRMWLGHTIPTVAFISFEPIFIVCCAPILSRVWFKLETRGQNPNPTIKFVLGFILTALAFGILSLSTQFYGITGLVNPLWIPIAYLVLTLSELLISPITLAAVTKLAPSGSVGVMMGVYLIGIGYGGKLAGVLAGWSSIPEGLSKIAENHAYGHAFLLFGLLALVSAGFVTLLSPWLSRLMRGVHCVA